MARHLCFERAYLDQLLVAGVLERDSNGKFDLDDNRRRYILHLREQRKRSPKSEADTDFQRAKSDSIRIRILEKQRQLINAEEVFAQIDEMVGMFLTGLSGFAARCGGRDLATRRAIDQAVMTCGLRYPKRRPSWRISAASLHWTKYDAPAMTGRGSHGPDRARGAVRQEAARGDRGGSRRSLCRRTGGRAAADQAHRSPTPASPPRRPRLG